MSTKKLQILGDSGLLSYNEQSLTDGQKKTARNNIGAGTSSFSGSYEDLTNKPTIPAAVNIDSTLSIEGDAADAKAVGDALAKKQPAGDYALNSSLGSLAARSTVSKSDLASDVQTSLGLADTALQSYTETDPTVPAWAKASTKPSYIASEVGLGNVDNVKQYSAENPPPYPVTSVNGSTGAVQISAVPSCTADNNGQFLRVVNGVATWTTIPNAEGASF